jgi:hypothetical protein
MRRVAYSQFVAASMVAAGFLMIGVSFSRPAAAQTLQVPDRTACGQLTTFHQAVPALETTSAGDAATQEIVKNIVAQLGMPVAFRLRAAPFGNIAATLCQDADPPERFVLYDPRLLKNVTAGTLNYWTLMFALAHEIGHHVNGHSVDEKDRLRTELEADFFAGYVLARLGAPQVEAAGSVGRLAVLQSALGAMGTPARLAEAERGWTEGKAAPVTTGSLRAAITIRPDTYVEGEGYRSIVNSTVPVCREACAQDKRCAMYEFHRPSRTCGLFDHATPGGTSSDAETGIKNQQRTQQAPAVARWAMAMQPDAYVRGEGYRTIRQTTPQVCQQACLADVRCAMYEFYRPTQGCGLFDHRRIADHAGSAEVGMKTPVHAIRLDVRLNVYVEGKGYRTIRDTATPACRAACMGDVRCAMYEMHRPSRSCGLFDHSNLSGPSDEAEAGIKIAR